MAPVNWSDQARPQHATSPKNPKPQFIIEIPNWESVKNRLGAAIQLSIVHGGAKTASSAVDTSLFLFVIGPMYLCDIGVSDHLDR